MKPAPILAKSGDENDPAAPADCRLTPAVNSAGKLWEVMKLRVLVNVDDV